jgi:hypothetical protein
MKNSLPYLRWELRGAVRLWKNAWIIESSGFSLGIIVSYFDQFQVRLL